TRFSGELTSPGNLTYGASAVSVPGMAFAGSGAFVAEDPRGYYGNDQDEFDSCQEYAYETFYDVTNFWYEVGRDRHDYLRTLQMAFDPNLGDTAIGWARQDGSRAPFHDRAGAYDVLPSFRNVYRNRFLDLPPTPAIAGGGIVTATGTPVATPPNLRLSMRDYSDFGAFVIQKLEAAEQVVIDKDMKFYFDHYQNLTVEAVQEPGFGFVDREPSDDPDPSETYQVLNPTSPSSSPFEVTTTAPDEAIAITGQVPLFFSGSKPMRRMFAAELDELYDLQVEKDRLVEEWSRLDRKYAGSGWTIQDLLEAYEIDEFQVEIGSAGTGTCCGPMEFELTSGEDDSDGDFVSTTTLSGGPSVGEPETFLEGENLDRKRVLDGFIGVYAMANEMGCLGTAPTHCDFSPKEFALEAVSHAVEEQQTAYEECVALLPSPFTENLGQTRWLIDPEADTQFADDPAMQTIVDTFKQGEGAGLWTLIDATFACAVEIPSPIRGVDLEDVLADTQYCQSRKVDYQRVLANFLAQAELSAEKAAARERLAEIGDLRDPDTGEIKRPGRVTSWAEDKGGKYFGLSMAYNYGFDTDVDDDLCNFDLIAGGDFAATVTILTSNRSLIDVAAWVRMRDQEIELRSSIMGQDLFTEVNLSADDLPDGQTLGFDAFSFVRGDRSRRSDLAGWDQRFMLGPVPLSLELGVGGALGYAFDLEGEMKPGGATEKGIDLCPEMGLTSTIRPYVAAYGFLEVAIDIGVAAAGIRGELNIMELSTPVEIDISLEAVDAQTDLGIDLALGVGMSVHADFETLSGRTAVFGEIGPCPFCKRVERDVIRWDGFQFRKTIFAQDYAVSVNDLMLGLPE
ncbi:MAG: hypothetical protein AAGC67_12340, partial [Myxococcota bacterium]